MPSLAQRLWSKLVPFRQKFHKANNSSTTAPSETAPSEMTYAPSDFDKRRIENIKRNNEMLRLLGLETVPEDANVKLKQSKKMKKNLNSSSSDEGGSSDDDGSSDYGSSGDVSQMDANNSEERKPSASITVIPVVKTETSAVPAKTQKKKPTIDLTTEDDATTPFIYLVGTTHYDPDDDAKVRDAGVFKVDSVVVEHYKDGAEVVVYRCKYNETTRTWYPVNMADPIRVADVVQYGNNEKYTTKMNRILSMK